jgi:hypothetical protein
MRLLIALFFTATVLHAGGVNDARIAELFAKTGKTHAAAPWTKPVAMAVGQWVMFGITDDDGERMVMKQSIIEKDGDVVTIEMVTINEDDVIMQQLTVKGLFDGVQRGNVDDVEILKVRMKTNDDEPVEVESFILKMAQGMYSKAFKGWVTETKTVATGEDVTVPAGTFKGTTVVTSEMTATGESEETKSWVHPAVPMSGVVKSTYDGGDYTMVLLDYGMTGAKASF